MSVDREMTLKEWCARLPSIHLVNKELADLEAKLAEAQIALKDAARTMKVYGTANMVYVVERCEKALKGTK